MHFKQLLYLSAGSMLSTAEDYRKGEGEGENWWLWAPSCCRHQRVCAGTCALEVRHTPPALFHARWELPSPSPRRTHFPSSLELLLAQEQYRPCVIISSQQIPSLHCMPSKLSGVFLVIPDVPYVRTSFSSFKFWASALRCDTNVLTWRNTTVCLESPFWVLEDILLKIMRHFQYTSLSFLTF